MDRPISMERAEARAEQEAQAFEQRYVRFSDRLERFLMQAVILGLVGLTCIQTLYVFPPVRRVANAVEALEGIPEEAVTAWNQYGGGAATPASATTAGAATPGTGGAVTPAGTGTLTIQLSSKRSAPEVTLLIDGRPAGSFASGKVTARVAAGQSVVIDGSRAREKLDFRVVGSTGLSRPALGTVAVTRSDRRSLGLAELAH